LLHSRSFARRMRSSITDTACGSGIYAKLRPDSELCHAHIDDMFVQAAGSEQGVRRRPYSHRQREEEAEGRLTVEGLRRLLQEAQGSADRGTAADVSALAAK